MIHYPLSCGNDLNKPSHLLFLPLPHILHHHYIGLGTLRDNIRFETLSYFLSHNYILVPQNHYGIRLSYVLFIIAYLVWSQHMLKTTATPMNILYPVRSFCCYDCEIRIPLLILSPSYPVVHDYHFKCVMR